MSGDGEQVEPGSEPPLQGTDLPVPAMEPDFGLVGQELKASQPPERANAVERADSE